MTWVLFGVMVYVAVQLAVGLFVARGMRNEEDYLLAGRSLGIAVSTMTVFATWFGAETCIGSSGAIYGEGLSGGRADPFGYTLCILVMGTFFAATLWKRGAMTLGDLVRTAYGPTVEKIAVILTAPTSILWAAAQIRAFGQVLSASSSLSTEIAVAIAAGVVILYTASGGMLADAITDFIQGIAIIIGLVVLSVAIGLHPPDWSTLQETLTPERLSLHAPGDTIFMSIEQWLIPIAGSLFIQELISRILAARSPEIAQRSCFYASGIYFVAGLIPVVLGLLGPALVPGLADQDQFLPTLAQLHLPTFIYILFAGALISAILSTVDSTLLAAGAVVAHNMVVPICGIRDEKKKLLTARVVVVLSGIAAYALAQGAEGVYALVEASSTFGSAGIFVVILFTFFKTRGGPYSAGAALVVGALSHAYLDAMEYSTPYLLSVGISFGVYIALMFFRRLPPEAELQQDMPASAA